MVRSIHYLRGVAALLVVFFHFRHGFNFYFDSIGNFGDVAFGNGYVGVDIFFIVSGFVIVLSTNNESKVFDFVVKRFFRVYPLYFFVLTVVLLSGAWNNFSTQEIIRSFFLVLADYSGDSPQFGYSLIGISWTISYEVLFYLIFCIALSISGKYRVELSLFFIFLSVFGVGFFIGGSVELDPRVSIPPSYGVLRFISSPILLDFVVGMLLAVLFTNRDWLVLIRKLAPFIIVVGVFYFLFFLYYSVFTEPKHGVLHAGFAAFMLILAFLLIESYYEFGNSQLLDLSGTISYSIYLNQGIVLAADHFVVKLYGRNVESPIFMLFEIIVVILLSVLTYKYIESPGIRMSKFILRGKNG